MGAILRHLEIDDSDKFNENIVKEQFAEWDIDGNGTLSYEELETCFQKIDFKLRHDEFLKLLRIVDVDKDGEINQDEFAAIFSANEYEIVSTGDDKLSLKNIVQK